MAARYPSSSSSSSVLSLWRCLRATVWSSSLHLHGGRSVGVSAMLWHLCACLCSPWSCHIQPVSPGPWGAAGTRRGLQMSLTHCSTHVYWEHVCVCVLHHSSKIKSGLWISVVLGGKDSVAPAANLYRFLVILIKPVNNIKLKKYVLGLALGSRQTLAQYL